AGDLVRLLLEGRVLRQDERRRAEGVRLDDVGPRLEIRSVNRLDDVGPGEIEIFVASLKGLSAEVPGGEAQGLDRRPHGAVEDEDPGAERFLQAFIPVHARRISPPGPRLLFLLAAVEEK